MILQRTRHGNMHVSVWLRRVNNIAAGHSWAAEPFFLRKEPKVKAVLMPQSIRVFDQHLSGPIQNVKMLKDAKIYIFSKEEMH